MKIYISSDIEGVAGVVAPQQGQPGNPEYERARRLMTEECSAAVDGAFAGGASEVVVNDAHGPKLNLLPDLLDPRAELILGQPKPMSMFAGLTADHAGVLCLGYHSGAGQPGVLSHTVSGLAFRAIRLNGRDCAEATLYGAYAGSLGVPVIMLSGDDAMAAQCGPLFPGAEVAVVKHALGQRAARSMSPARARECIRAAAERAVRNAREVAPFRIPVPCRLELDLTSPALADLVGIVPAAQRIGPASVAFEAETVEHAVRWVSIAASLASALR